MCEQCMAETRILGQPIPGWYLVRAKRDGNWMRKGDWGLVECNDPTYVFSTTPWIDPVHGWTDDQINAATQEENDLMDKWMDDMYAFEEQLAKFDAGVDAGWRLIEACREAGFKPGINADGSCANWLFHQLGKLVADASI